MYIPLDEAGRYFKNFPTTFCNYENKIVLENREKREFFDVIAEKVASLYATAMQSPVRFMSSYQIQPLKPEQINTFHKKLSDYIFKNLTEDRPVTLTTEKAPQSELKAILEESGIDLETPAKKEIFFLPYKSEVYLSPRIMEEYGIFQGLEISMQRA